MMLMGSFDHVHLPRVGKVMISEVNYSTQEALKPCKHRPEAILFKAQASYQLH